MRTPLNNYRIYYVDGVYEDFYTTTTVDNADYDILVTDYYVSVVNLTASRTLGLPDAEEGQVFIIKDTDGLFGTYPVTILSPGTIDGSASIVMNTAYMSLTFVYDGVSNYELI